MPYLLLPAFWLVIIVIEVNKKLGFGVYFVVGVLSMLLVADKEAAVMYVMFFPATIPIIKAMVEKKAQQSTVLDR